VALAFDAGDAFAIDKPAGTPCPNLDCHSCKIHSDLKDKGFLGCIAYSCAGAGQHTIALYDGQSWQNNPDLLPAQMDTFRHLNRLHALLELLTAASILALPKDVEQTRLNLIAQLFPGHLTPQMAQVLADGPLPSRVNDYLRSLAKFAPNALNCERT